MHQARPGRRRSRLITPEGVTPTAYAIDPVTGCWLWQHHVDSDGSPRAVVDQVEVLPAHIACAQVSGPIPAGHVLAATCAHRRCICPDHRVAVPRSEIAAATGRGLTTAQVVQLRAEASNHTLAELAASYGVSTRAIRDALSGRSWRGVGGDPVMPRKPPRPSTVREQWTGRLPDTRPDALPEREWQVLVAFVNGQTVQQIGDGLGITRQAAAAIAARASKRLAGLLAADEASGVLSTDEAETAAS